MTTIKQILKEHPEWGDLPLVFIDKVGNTHFVNTGNILLYETEYRDDEGCEKVLAISDS